MKIALVGGKNVPSSGGIENYIQNLAIQLKTKGHEPWIICRGEKYKDIVMDGVRITHLECKETQLSILMHNINASRFLIKEGNMVDVVNYQSIYLPFFYEWIPKRRGMKVIHTQHSFAQDNPKHGMLSRLIIRIIYRFSAFVFSPILTVSEHNKELVKRRLKKEAEVINCGVNLPILHDVSEVQLPKGIKPGRFYLTIGRIDPVKNLDVLIQAFLKHPEDSDMQLVICGDVDNAYGKRLRELARDDKRIIFYGPVFGDEKELLLRSCLAYCLVSTSEGFPIALLEAMSHGNICICSDIPANTETLPENCGLWCKVKDTESLYSAMKQLESNTKAYSNYGLCARKKIEEALTWDKISDKYIKYIKVVVGNL